MPRDSFFNTLAGIVRHPQQVLWLWNWKSAVLSIVLRGPIFLVAAARQGWSGSLSALFTESVFCAVTAGFYGALVQTLRNAEPEWLTILFLTTVVPAMFQVLEYSLHRLRGTPHLRLAEIVSLVVSAVSALFNWYAMRRGTLLVGGEGGSFGKDLRHLPRLLFNFLMALPRRLAGRPEPERPEAPQGKRNQQDSRSFYARQLPPTRKIGTKYMPLKSLHLTNSWHETSGGIATFYRALLAEANRRGHEIRLVVPGESDRTEEIGRFGRIYQVQSPPARLNSSYRMIYPSQFLLSGSKLQSILASERPNLVEVCDKYTLNYFAALLRKQLLPSVNYRPVVVGLSCERMDDNFHSYIGRIPFSSAFCSQYMKWVYFPFFDHHIANSDYTADELRIAAQGHLVPRGTWIRPMGIDLNHLSPERRSAEMRQRMLRNCGGSEDSILLLYVGRLVPEKNLPLLFELLLHLSREHTRDFRLLVVGDGIDRERWEQFCKQRMQRRAMFFGHVKDRNALADLYANADVFVHPNPREPFGIAPLEAMASGLALVSPNRGGVTSYANARNAWTIDATVESFAAAVKEVAGNERLRIQKTALALQTARDYSWEKIAASFLDLYSGLCQTHRMHSDMVPAPSFYSTPAASWQAIAFRGVSMAAERIFLAASAFASSTSG